VARGWRRYLKQCSSIALYFESGAEPEASFPLTARFARFEEECDGPGLGRAGMIKLSFRHEQNRSTSN